MYNGDSVRVLGNSHFRIYLIGSEQKILLECGVSGVVPLVKSQVEEKSCKRVGHLVAMHAHFDHVCGIPGLQGIFSEAVTAASQKAAEVLSRLSVLERFFKEDAAMTETLQGLNHTGCEVGGGAGSFTPPAGITVGRVINDGELWQLGTGLSVHFSLAPGHSPCGLVAYCPEKEILFSSDSAGFPVDKKTVFPIFFDGYQAYVQTLKRMMDLPVTVLAGAHEDIINGRREVADYLHLALAWAEEIREEIIDGLRRGIDRETLARRIFDRFYRGNLKIYTGENIMLCSRLIVKRAEESEKI
ncbi:MAG: MBL fold metallo-hydrolase [Desulfocucumaceae bacterium]